MRIDKYGALKTIPKRVRLASVVAAVDAQQCANVAPLMPVIKYTHAVCAATRPLSRHRSRQLCRRYYAYR